MNSHRAMLCGITLGLALSPAPAFAQQALSADLRTPGVAVDTVVPDVRDRAAASTVTELVRGRAPGLNILEASGVAGASPRLWIRGRGTVGLTDHPLVVVDGVRIDSDPDAFGVDYLSVSTSRLADLSPDDVASVRVLRGPAGAAAYGPEGAAGVLEITTHRAGAPGVHAWSSLGVRQQRTDFPESSWRRGRATDVYDTEVDNCAIRLEVSGLCIPSQSGVSTTNPLRADSAFRTGVSTNVGVRLTGSADGGRTGYMLSAGTQRVEGTLRDNADGLRNLRAALSHRGRGARVAVTAAHVRRETDLPVTGSAYQGILGVGLNASGVPGFTRDGVQPSPAMEIGEDARHTTLGAFAEVDVLPWMSVGTRGGRDETDSEGTARFGGQFPGVQTDTDEQTRWHWSAHATARVGRAAGVRGALTAGLEQLGGREKIRTEFVSRGASGFDESTTRSRGRALFAHGTAQWRSLRVGGTLRGDQPDRGADDETRLAYSLGGEWALDGVLPRGGWLGGVTLRAAHGRVARGLEWLRTPVFVRCPSRGCAPPPPLETVTETEAGVDARLFGRVELALTGYVRRTDDLLGVGGGPSGGAGFESGGEVHNRGVELAAAVNGPENGAVGWRVDLTASANRNEYRAVNGTRFGPVGSTANRDGYPLGSYFERAVTGFTDLDGDGVLARCDAIACEVEFSQSTEYAGTPTPDRLASLGGTLRLRRASLHVRADWAGGAEMMDYTSAYRCVARGNCAAGYDRSLPLEQQADILAAVGLASLGGFVHEADFARLREVALTLSVPSGWAARFGGAQVDLTVAGRNLATWTDYPGLDPETSAGGSALFAAIDAFEQPLSRSIVTRIDVRF